MRCGLRALGGTKAGDARACGPRGDSLARTREPKGQNLPINGPCVAPAAYRHRPVNRDHNSCPKRALYDCSLTTKRTNYNVAKKHPYILQVYW